MEEKLYQFLLVDERMMGQDSEFEDYSIIASKKWDYLYEQLLVRYGRAWQALCFLGKYTYKLGEKQKKEEKNYIELTNEIIKNLCEEQEKLQERINQIKSENDISDDDIKNLFMKYTGVANSKSAKMAEVLEEDEELLNSIKKVNRLNLKLFRNQEQIRVMTDKKIDYQKMYREINILKIAFKKSDCFFVEINDGKWISKEEELINELYWFYSLNVSKDRPQKTELEVTDGREEITVDEEECISDEEAKNAELYEKLFGVDWEKDIIEIDETDQYDWILERISGEIEKIKKDYLSKEELKDILQKEFENDFSWLEEVAKQTADLRDLAVHIRDYDEDELVNNLYPKKGGADLRDAYINTIETYHKNLEKIELEYGRQTMIGDADFEKIVRVEKKLGEKLKEYNEYRNTKYEKANSAEELEKQRNKRADNLKKQRDALRAIFDLLIELYKFKEEENDLNRTKRTSFEGVIKRVYKKIQNTAKIRDSRDPIEKARIHELIQQMYYDADNHTRKEISFTSRYNYWSYKDKGIITLNFPNSKIEKYKTAAIIVDKNDLDKVFVNSAKNCWTFKGGAECSSAEYKVKTYKPDKITESGGKLNLLYRIKGKPENPFNTWFYFESHKFDYRSKSISAMTKEEIKEKDKFYYEGKLRIEKDDDEFSEDRTVCINNEENTNNAAILYFDDIDRFKKFLDAM